MRLYKEVELNQYAWTLFFLLNQIPWDEANDKYEEKDLGGGLTMKVRLSSGFGLSKKAEMDKLSACRYLKVYTDEVELSIMTSDRYLYKYESETDDKSKSPVKGLGIIGSYIYITNEEVCSPIFIKSKTYVAKPYFENFREYALEGETLVEDFHISYSKETSTFLVAHKKDNDSFIKILEINGVGKNATYGFVYYILSSIQVDENTVMMEDYKVKKIEKVWNE